MDFIRTYAHTHIIHTVTVAIELRPNLYHFIFQQNCVPFSLKVTNSTIEKMREKKATNATQQLQQKQANVMLSCFNN